MDLYNKIGKIAIANRMGLLTSHITDDLSTIFNVSSRWLPVLVSLLDQGKLITQISTETAQCEADVAVLVDEIYKAGLLNEITDGVISLSEQGQKTTDAILKDQAADVEAAIDGLVAESKHNLYEALREWQQLLDQKSLLKRVVEQKKQRESKDVQIVDYTEQYKSAFRDLNVEWISKYFVMEENDYKSLDHADEYIIAKGGRILVALLNGEPVGVCALVKMFNSPYDYEMAKMAVSPKAQGKSIGFILGKAIANLAKELGASKVYLETNTILIPAINLYKKLGFKELVGVVSAYKRGNYHMELDLTK
ncbi:hypothetical protein CYY_003533 [Polysphondylium violaceum]|uniref:N-acetyltransferase domain-containing protein n=1 Tax=Polysphondylium violaceum TaxID=133409 RepID=A0A8J4PW69_9MYCE|nr:hypothetical protein CYY_003533 [Polysphondylium violaceum]